MPQAAYLVSPCYLQIQNTLMCSDSGRLKILYNGNGEMVLETFLLPLPSPPYVMYIYKYVNVKNNCVLWIQLVTFYKGLQSFKVYFLTCRRFV